MQTVEKKKIGTRGGTRHPHACTKSGEFVFNQLSAAEIDFRWKVTGQNHKLQWRKRIVQTVGRPSVRPGQMAGEVAGFCETFHSYSTMCGQVHIGLMGSIEITLYDQGQGTGMKRFGLRTSA